MKANHIDQRGIQHNSLQFFFQLIETSDPRCFKFSSKSYKIVGPPTESFDSLRAEFLSGPARLRTWDDFKGDQMPHGDQFSRAFKNAVAALAA